jgi:DHA1 family multidrug resistance protein-like MFS transporter
VTGTHEGTRVDPARPTGPSAESEDRSEPGSPIDRRDWRLLFLVFWLTSLVEGIGVSQVFAFLPSYLLGMGVTGEDRLRFVGAVSALIFVVGAPLVPLWGVWADKYSRKAVIARSAFVEATVFGAVALSREPWQLALSVLLTGFQLGNTGVMLAALRDAAPPKRLGAIIALFGASGPIGFAVGPALGGLIVDGLHQGLPTIYAVSAGLSLLTGLLVLFTAEVRPEVVPSGRVVRLAYGAVRGIVADPAVRRVFTVFGVAFLAGHIARPFLPVLVEQLNPSRIGLASDIALVAGTAALAGALISPLGGWIGDRIGFQPVLIAALAGGGVALAVEPFAPSVPLLAAVAFGFAAFNSVVSAMVFGLLATEVPPDRRSATLNLVYLPLYAAGVIGPAAGAVLVGFGIALPFVAGGTVSIAAAAVLVARNRRRVAKGAATAAHAGQTPAE